ncbi:MAG: hypothetical protein JWP91_1442 [Fibrobacteres bacterium]|nr:hypothetical protein [Fibrobacterota bacterium]
MIESRPALLPILLATILSAVSVRVLAAPAPADTETAADSAIAQAENDGRDTAEADPIAEAEGDEGEGSDQPLWMDSYGEGVFSRHDDRNLSGFTEFKVGKRFKTRLPMDLYLKTRLYRDQRDFYWNNRADAGAGARVSLLKKVSLTLFGEVVAGQYLRLSSGALGFGGLQGRIEGNRAAIDAAQSEYQAMYKEIFQAHLLDDPKINRETIAHLDTTGNIHLQNLVRLNARLDSLETSKDSMSQAMDSIGLVPAGAVTEYRAGLVFWHAWGQDEAEGEGPAEGSARPRFRFPLRFWGEAYSDWIFSSLSRHVRSRGGGEAYRDSVARFRNLIFYANPDVGMMLMEGLAGSVSAYGTAYVWFDTHKDWWNNLAMAGPGLRYKPLGALDLVFKAEYLWGRYYGRERKEDPNPYARNLRDVRLTGSFWYGLGI